MSDVVLVTGCAGFIGMHVCKELLLRGEKVIGVDNINDYYDQNLKMARLGNLTPYTNFRFNKIDITDYEKLNHIFAENNPSRIINLAAQAGVRYSIENPHIYIQSNIVGFMNILELSRHYNIKHLVYASSSSVYGSNTKMPLSVHDSANHPVSLYAATKKSNEMMAHAYSHLYNLPVTGLRYFTVYGPWGRPDMSPWLFTSAIMEEREIKVFNNGEMWRDFTYIDDVVKGTISALDSTPYKNHKFPFNHPDPSSSSAPYKIYNIGNNSPTRLMTFIETLETAIGKKAIKKFMPMQSGDVVSTHADTDKSEDEINFKANVPLQQGLKLWCDWYVAYHKKV